MTGAQPMDIDAPCTPVVPPTPPTPGRASGPPGSQGPGSESQGGLDGWVQCDLCNKWRKLPKGTPLPGDEVTSANCFVHLGDGFLISANSDQDKWFCFMSPDEQRNACEYPEETAEEVIN